MIPELIIYENEIHKNINFKKKKNYQIMNNNTISF